MLGLADDLREDVRAAKDGGRLYHRTDTHWNALGAFAAYTGLCRELGFVPTPSADFERAVVEGGPAGDLAGMLGLADDLREERIELARKSAASARPGPLSELIEGKVAAYGWTHERVPRVMIGADAALPSAVIVHDSFMLGMLPFLSEHFARAVYLSHTFEPELILAEHPTLVIDEVVERQLGQPLPVNPAPLAGFQRRAQ
jgi:hypothetical protein